MTEIADPLQLPCGVRLRNRLVKAAMSEQLAADAGAPSEGLIRLYEQWGRSGCGVLLTGNVMLDHRRRGEPGNVVVEDTRHLGMLARWVEAATREGTQLWMQINHPGRQSPRTLDPHPVAPSAVPLRLPGGAFAPPRALERAEIEDIVQRFATTSAIAKQAGFGGVQIHAAHGYLISQFLSPQANLRDDDYGGDAKRRRRFLLDIVQAVRAAVGPEFAISVKLNSADFQRGGFSEDESIDVVRELERLGIDLLEISGGTYERAVMFNSSAAASTQAREAFFLDYAEKVRVHVRLPLMLTGGFRTLAGMNAALASGAVDMIGVARPLAVEPDLPKRLLSGESRAARVVSLESPIALLNSVLVGAWYQAQLRRMSEGRAPDPQLGRTRALLGYLRAAIAGGGRTRRSL